MRYSQQRTARGIPDVSGLRSHPWNLPAYALARYGGSTEAFAEVEPG